MTRTREEQIAGLDRLMRLTATSRINVLLVDAPGDVVYMHAQHYERGPREVVYAEGGYDVWRGQDELLEADVSAEVAAQVLVDDYRKLKAAHMGRTLPGVSEEYARAWLDAGEPTGEAGRHFRRRWEMS